jgi:hypothetical protein
MRVFITAFVLPRSPQLCQNGGLTVLASTMETEESKVTTVMLLLVKHYLVKKEV